MKKLFFFAFAFICLSATSVVSYAQSVWDGSKAPFDNGDGTQTNPYLIEDAKHLAYLAYLVNNGIDATDHIIGLNTYYKMTVDINLNGNSSLQWTPIGYYVDDVNFYAFGGHFDGNNKTIYNLYINTSAPQKSGLFGMIGAGSLKNLTLSGTAISVQNAAGAFVGLIRGEVTIENVLNMGSVSAGAWQAGGIVGYNEGELTISKACNMGAVSAVSSNETGRAGGIIGNSNGWFMMSQCYNLGNVSAIYAGGMVGMNFNISLSTAIINECCNTGTITANCAGGILGNNAYNPTNISNVYNMGKIVSNYYSGGIVGGMPDLMSKLNISNVYHAGTADYAVAANQGATITNAHYLSGSAANANNAAVQTETFMKSLAMVTQLGVAFAQDTEPYFNNGFPVLFGVNYPTATTTLTATGITQTKATLNGAFFLGVKDILGRGFEYKLTTESNYTPVNLSGTATSHILTALTPGKQYQFRSFIKITETNIIYGSVMAFNTLSVSATTKEATDITRTSAILNGTTNFGDATVLKQGFILTTPTGEETIELSTTATSLTHTLTNLPRGAAYSYKTYCTTAHGTVYGDVKQFTTLLFNQNGMSNLIGSIDDLLFLAQLVGEGNAFSGQKFLVTNDITLPATPNSINAIGTYPAHPFSGEFDGNSRKIVNLYLDHATDSYQGLFGYAKNSTIYNLGLVNVTVNAKEYTGGIVAYAENTKITSCYVSGGAISSSSYCGGLAGYQSPGATSGITSCYSTATVTGSSNAGGLVGYSSQGSLRNSYAAGAVTGQSSTIGGVIGAATNVTVYNCFFNGEITGQSVATGGSTTSEGMMSSEEMRKAEFVTTLNQSLPVPAWKVDYGTPINNGFPILLWQFGGGFSIETLANDAVKVYPNPTSGELRITNCELGMEAPSVVEVEIFDTYGRKISSNHLITSSSNQLINISHLPSGVYFVKIATEAGVVVKRVVKE
ncbi:MAG: T9SS type A sorting domain-containing protein [Lentimicrobiaceae bacterium]|nr:T9SS type A sorting domain-containing protein [Lentimicrobiaceae bacterium]